jgi:PIN domain nuclease of toxin-antitoxin system
MKYLLDTHVFIWIATADKRLLSSKTLKILKNPDNELYISSISLWEVAIKTGLGKLELPKPFDTFIEQERKIAKIKLCNYSLRHIKEYAILPFYGKGNQRHNDPFDRMLICQSLVEKMPIISADSKFNLYPKLNVIW